MLGRGVRLPTVHTRSSGDARKTLVGPPLTPHSRHEGRSLPRQNPWLHDVEANILLLLDAVNENMRRDPKSVLGRGRHLVVVVIILNSSQVCGSNLQVVVAIGRYSNGCGVVIVRDCHGCGHHSELVVVIVKRGAPCAASAAAEPSTASEPSVASGRQPVASRAGFVRDLCVQALAKRAAVLCGECQADGQRSQQRIGRRRENQCHITKNQRQGADAMPTRG
eukprot:1155522-Rhodomonas_salina.1